LKLTGDASEQGGGAINFSANLTVGLRNAPSTGINMGIVTIANSGQLSVPQLLLGENSAADNANGAVYSIINLDGGIVTTQQIKAGAATGSDLGTKSTRLVNFNGGTVKVANPTAFGSSFLQGITAATVYSGGATIDTNNVNVTIAQPLVAPTKNGLASIAVTDGGTKYRSAPIVAITNDPSETAAGGGSAVATIDASGHVTGIVITNPGSYTVLPQIHLIANGGDTADGAELPYGGTKAAFTAALTANPLASGGFTKIGPGLLSLTGNNTYSGSTTVAAGTLKVNTAAAAPLLSNAAGTDIKGGKVAFDYTAAADPAAYKNNLKSLLHTGYASNFASGQIHSSTATPQIGLGYSDDSGSSSFTVARAYYGDLNLDGTVNTDDFGALALNYNKSGQDWINGDFNYDGVVNALDFNSLATNYGSTLPVAAPALGALVPEPATICLIGVAGLALARRRRR
jgi:autotransporter-associated beta strand protein